MDPKPMSIDMTINITQKAREFLQKTKKNKLYIKRMVLTECCIPLSTPPAVRKGSPRKLENFYEFYVEGITVYYDRDLIRKAELTIDTKGFGWSEQLMVTDWVIRY
ncbi:hypothetical protein Desor_0716 [Desulfosporosinus orientis DSM 765]|uniref:Uncharacterized protein n=1 Tax=Desulfosporosinus orientis (strain ATCC 19365 / DSM 765 / NCIMB 8382 / VKM B-1628 / Singapore I) TaxID=768706 RepID=G7W7X9_DESOD|nr:CC/Se motif family (seleno)protein [Desulfosporosinus orientis]AET66405.1 hypothetical protein Desor_0716 [Desulfosporosinus orientis DSM 765]